MAERDLTSCGAQAVLGLSVCVLLSCTVGNVLLAVTESVWWPVVAAVVMWGAAAGVAVWATAASTSRWRTRRAVPASVAEVVPTRRG
jgi:membrane protein YdbS with pleckstrin-like domain